MHADQVKIYKSGRTRRVCNEARPIAKLRYRRLWYMLVYLVSGQLALRALGLVLLLLPQAEVVFAGSDRIQDELKSVKLFSVVEY